MARRRNNGLGAVVSPQFPAVLAAIASDSPRAILVELARGPRDKEALAKSLGLSRSAIARHLRQLSELQLVRVVRPESPPIYQLGRLATGIVGGEEAVLNVSTSDGNGITLTMPVQSLVT